MKLNTYGMTMKGLKKASGETRNYGDYGAYVQVSYDMETGEVLTNWHADCNSWTAYREAEVIGVCNTSRHMTMQQLADAIRDRVAELEALGTYA